MKRPTKIYFFGWSKENRIAAKEKMQSGKFEAIYICTKSGKLKQALVTPPFGNGLHEIVNY